MSELYIATINPSEVWFAYFELPHSVDNKGKTERIHLVLDCNNNEWMHKMLEKSCLFSVIKIT